MTIPIRNPTIHKIAKIALSTFTAFYYFNNLPSEDRSRSIETTLKNRVIWYFAICGLICNAFIGSLGEVGGLMYGLAISIVFVIWNEVTLALDKKKDQEGYL